MAAKGLVRVTPVANFLSAGLQETAAGTVYDLGAVTSSMLTIYGALHLVSCSAVSWTFKLQSASACAFLTPTDRFTFTAQACSGAQWPTPLAYPAAVVDQTARYWRGQWTPTATTDTRLGLLWVAIQ